MPIAPDTKIHSLLASSLWEQQEFGVELIHDYDKLEDPSFVQGALRFAIGRGEFRTMSFHDGDREKVLDYLCRHPEATASAVLHLPNDVDFRAALVLIRQSERAVFPREQALLCKIRVSRFLRDPGGQESWERLIENVTLAE